MSNRILTQVKTDMTFFMWLQIAFICFKVTDQIDWSWWWVFVPTYAEMLINILIEFGRMKK